MNVTIIVAFILTFCITLSYGILCFFNKKDMQPEIIGVAMAVLTAIFLFINIIKMSSLKSFQIGELAAHRDSIFGSLLISLIFLFVTIFEYFLPFFEKLRDQ